MENLLNRDWLLEINGLCHRPSHVAQRFPDIGCLLLSFTMKPLIIRFEIAPERPMSHLCRKSKYATGDAFHPLATVVVIEGMHAGIKRTAISTKFTICLEIYHG